MECSTNSSVSLSNRSATSFKFRYEITKFIILYPIQKCNHKQIREYVNSFGGEVFKNFDETKVISEKKILSSKQKPEIHQTLEKAVKRISSTELMQRIFSVLEDIGI